MDQPRDINLSSCISEMSTLFLTLYTDRMYIMKLTDLGDVNSARVGPQLRHGGTPALGLQPGSSYTADQL